MTNPILQQLIEQQCLKHGSFTFTSGDESSVYFYCKKAMLNGLALDCIAESFLKKIKEFDDTPTAIGGPTLGADFIVAAVLQRSHQLSGTIVNGSIVRKQVKRHGTLNRIENQLPAGTKVVVVDDVITSGKSISRACDEFLDYGYEVVGIVGLIDREAGGAEWLSGKYNVAVKSIFTASDFSVSP